MSRVSHAQGGEGDAFAMGMASTRESVIIPYGRRRYRVSGQSVSGNRDTDLKPAIGAEHNVRGDRYWRLV